MEQHGYYREQRDGESMNLLPSDQPRRSGGSAVLGCCIERDLIMMCQS